MNNDITEHLHHAYVASDEHTDTTASFHGSCYATGEILGAEHTVG